MPFLGRGKGGEEEIRLCVQGNKVQIIEQCCANCRGLSFIRYGGELVIAGGYGFDNQYSVPVRIGRDFLLTTTFRPILGPTQLPF